MRMSIFAAAVNQVPPTPSIDFEAMFEAILRFILTVRYDILALIGKNTYHVLQFAGTFLILAFLVGLVYVAIKTRELELVLEAQHQPLPVAEESKETVRKVKWERILGHVDSVNPGDWRLAILEADILLDEMLTELGVAGETVAEKLKATSDKTLPSLQKAWEAHLVRNKIAHEGPNFEIGQREARRVIALFDEVLRQGGYL